MRVAIYVRVSTEDQAREGFSLDAQEKRLRAYCAVRGWEVVDVYRDEGQSGRDIDRPAYRRMMDQMPSWDTLLVLKMDRIHRNSVNFTNMMDELKRNGKEFASLSEKFDTTSAMGRFVMDIIQRMAQLESEQIGERVKIGMTRKAQTGDGPMGSGEPYGYRYAPDGLVVIKNEAETVARIFDMACNGLSIGEIAARLTNANIPSKKGGAWSRQSVYKILHNPLYAGYVRWDGIVRPGTHAAIVDLSTFEAVNGPLVKTK